MKWTLDKLMHKADREDVCLSDLAKRGARKRAAKARALKPRYVSKPVPEQPYWEK